MGDHKSFVAAMTMGIQTHEALLRALQHCQNIKECSGVLVKKPTSYFQPVFSGFHLYRCNISRNLIELVSYRQQ